MNQIQPAKKGPDKLQINFEKVLIIADVFRSKYKIPYQDLVKKSCIPLHLSMKRKFIFFINEYTNLFDYEIAELFEINYQHENYHKAKVINEFIKSYKDELIYNPSVKREHQEIKSLIDKIIIYPLT